MKKKLCDLVTALLFCGFLGVMLVLFLALPKEDFSQREKRVLASVPDGAAENVLSGQWGQEAEEYIADHLPGRDFFVGLSSYYDLLSGRQGTKSILLAQGDRLLEAPYIPADGVVERNMGFVNAFAQTLGRPVDLMIVPSAGALLGDTVLGRHDAYRDAQVIEDIYAQGRGLDTVDVLGAFRKEADPGSLYYRTDHHWTAYGAYRGAGAYLETKGRSLLDPDAFQVERHGGFYGTTHSRAGLWLVPGEEVELWDDGGSYTVTAYNSSQDTQGVSHEGLYYRENLSQLDKYTVYLNGNQPLVRIHNPQGQGSILVIRDSYGNSLAPFLAASYEHVVLVDLRYYRTSMAAFAQQEQFDDILICYSIGNFLTDTNLPWLVR